MPKILVVDDEKDICELLLNTLQKIGFQASYSLTIKGAVEVLTQESFDLIFIDLNLTDGSGYDLINKIGELKLKSKFVVISAFDSERQKVLSAGADFFIAKPFSKTKVVDALQQLNLLAS